MLAYKVVEKNTRHCSNWTIYRQSYIRTKDEIKFRKDNIQYFPRYLKGTVVKEVPGSVGIMCFKTIKYAINFILENNLNAKIVKVYGYNKKRVKYISMYCGSSPENVINLFEKTTQPDGTIAFKKVRVLE